MKNYKRIIAVICILTLSLTCFNLSVFADDGYTVTFSNNNTQVTVEIGGATGPEVDILTDETLNVKANGKFPAETSTGATVLSFGSWSKGLVAANNPASVGDVGYYCLPSSKTFQSVLQGSIEDYNLEVTFSKEAQNTYIQDIEIGLGNANGTSGYGTLPMVVKTYPLGNFGYGSAANHTEWTLTVDVRDILQNGTETRFPGTNGGTINNLTGSNVNFFAVKANYCRASEATAKLMQFSRIKFVPKSEGTGLPSSYALITAFYDSKENLISVDYDDNAPTSITTSVPQEAYSLRCFVWSDFSDTLIPLRAKYEVLVPVKRSVLFVGGRGAYDSATKLRTLALSEGYDIDVVCAYYMGRDLQGHWRNACTGERDYSVQINGAAVNGSVSVSDALTAKAYDWVILEQSSGYAGIEDSIMPYLSYLENFVYEKCPDALVYYNTLWPYYSGYTGSVFGFYDNDPEVMRDKINEAAAIVDDETGAAVINTNNIVYLLANVDGYSLYSKEDDSTFYRLNDTGKAAVQSQIFYSLTNKKPAASNIMSVFSGVSMSTAEAILNHLE